MMMIANKYGPLDDWKKCFSFKSKISQRKSISPMLGNFFTQNVSSKCDFNLT